MITTLTQLSTLYILCLTVLFLLVIEAASRRSSTTWRIPALFVYLTTGVWYLFEAIYFPEQMTKFHQDTVNISYIQIILFLLFFRIFVSIFHHIFGNNLGITSYTNFIQAETVLKYLIIIWLFLLAFGIFRMRGDIVGALFPLSSRAGVHMWAREAGAGAGSSGFIVSSATYVYMLVCAFFGILLSLQTTKEGKFINFVIFLIVLPYYLLMGSRNQLLAVVMPGYFHYAIFSKQGGFKKIVFTFIIFITLNYAMTIIITFRNVGFAAYFDMLAQGQFQLSEQQQHLGFNMLEELGFINVFLRNQLLQLDYGWGYLVEALNFIPRAIWSNKPLLGIDYAILRGYGSSSSDIGVFATLSTGLIGQGVMGFGPFFGPLAPGLLLALWSTFLAKLLQQSQSLLRRCLFLVGLGLTFNLGRGISLLVLWPMIFGYVLVRMLEMQTESKSSQNNYVKVNVPLKNRRVKMV